MAYNTLTNSTIADGDFFIVRDTSASETKKISYANLAAGIQGSITNDSLPDDISVTSVTAGDILPTTDETGNVGTDDKTWENGRFKNIHIESTLNVRGVIDLADGDVLRLGNQDDIKIKYVGANNNLNITFASADSSAIRVLDDTTERIKISKDGTVEFAPTENLGVTTYGATISSTGGITTGSVAANAFNVGTSSPHLYSINSDGEAALAATSIDGNLTVDGDILPDADVTDSIGSSDYRWLKGHFKNIDVANLLNVRGAIDLGDQDELRLGGGDDAKLYYDHVDTGVILELGQDASDFWIRDGETIRFAFDRSSGAFTGGTNGTIGTSTSPWSHGYFTNLTASGDILPATDNSGSVGNSDYRWNSGHFSNITIDSILTVDGAIKLGDGHQIRFGDDIDARLSYKGTPNTVELELEDAATAFVISDNGTDIFTFAKNGTFTTHAGGIYSDGVLSAEGQVHGDNLLVDNNVTLGGSVVRSTGNTTGTIGTSSAPWSHGYFTNLTYGGSINPATDNTGNIGNQDYTWNSGRFHNFVVDNVLSVRGAVDLADSDVLRFGSGDDVTFEYDGTNNDFNVSMSSADVASIRINDGTDDIIKISQDGTIEIGEYQFLGATFYRTKISTAGVITTSGVAANTFYIGTESPHQHSINSDGEASLSTLTLSSTANPLTLNAVVFRNTEHTGYYSGGTGTLAFDENFYSDTGYGSGTYDPATVFTETNGGGLLIKNEDGWGAVFTSQNTRFATGTWASLKSAGGIYPTVDDSGSVGNEDKTWSFGRFTDFWVDSTLSVRGAIDLADGDQLRLGNGDDVRFAYNGTSNSLNLTMESADSSSVRILDGSDERIKIDKDGQINISPATSLGVTYYRTTVSTSGNITTSSIAANAFYIGTASPHQYSITSDGAASFASGDIAGDLAVAGGLDLDGTDPHIKFGPGNAANDDAHIEWKGGSNAGYLRISTSDDGGTEYIEFGDYNYVDRAGDFTRWLKMSRGAHVFTGNILAATDGSGNVGTSDNTWGSGRFVNFHVESTLYVRGAIDLQDSDVLRFGTSDDAKFFYNGTSNYLALELESAAQSFIITDNGTPYFEFTKDGTLFSENLLPGSDNTGNVGDSDNRWNSGHFSNINVDSILTVEGAIKLGDGHQLRFGDSIDARLSYKGTQNRLELELEDAATAFDISDNGTIKITFAKTGKIIHVGSDSTAMMVASTSMSSQDDYVNSAISIRERGRVGTGQSDDEYAPNLNFHWAGRVSESLWMDTTGTLNLGSYSSAGVPARDGQFRTSILRANTLTNSSGQQLVLNAGESQGKINSQTAEYVYVNAESGLRISVPDAAHSNWASGYLVDYTQITRSNISMYTGMSPSTATGATRQLTIRHDGSNAVYDVVGDLRIEPSARLHHHRRGSSGGGQNRFEGLNAASTANGRGQFVISSSYSDLVIASSQSNGTHGSTLTFATYNPTDSTDYKKFVINQGNWGGRRQFLEFGYSNTGGRANPHSNINDSDTVLTLDGGNKYVGIGDREPSYPLDVAGSGRFTGSAYFGSVYIGSQSPYNRYITQTEARFGDVIADDITADSLTSSGTISIHGGNGADADLNLKAGDNVVITGGTDVQGAIYFRANSGSGSYRFAKSAQTSIEGLLSFESLTQDRVYTLPNASGNLAITDNGSVTKISNQCSNIAGNWHTFVNDGGGNIGQRWNSTATGTNNLVENGIAYRLVIDNDTSTGNYAIARGRGVNDTAGGAITWTNAFVVSGSDGTVRLYHNGNEKFITTSGGTKVTGHGEFSKGFAKTDTDNYQLKIRNTTAGGQAVIQFSDQSSEDQLGYLAWTHLDSDSNLAGCSWHFRTNQSSGAVIIDQTGSNSGFYVGTNKCLTEDGAFNRLRYDDNEKLRTENYGVRVTGDLGINTAPGNNLNARPTAFAIGDSDTGLAQNGDGVLEAWANNQVAAKFTSSRNTFYKEAYFDNNNQTSNNASYEATRVDADYSGTAAFTANRTFTANRVTIDNSKSNTTSTNGNRLYTRGIRVDSITTNYSHENIGMYSLAKQTGNGNGIGTQTLHGVYGYAQAYLAGGACNFYGGHFLAYRGNSCTGGTGYAVVGRAQSTSGSASGNLRGGLFEVQCDAGIVGDAIGVQSVIDRNAGTLTTGTLFYGTFEGTVSTKRGLILNGSTVNYLAGNVRSRSDMQLGIDHSNNYGADNKSYIAYHLASNNRTFFRGHDAADGTLIFQTEVGGEDNIEFTAAGNGYFDGGADIGNADYAEYFEWSDGNPNNEDRRGMTVVLVEDKIRPATADDDTSDIIGVVSAAPGVVGDSHEMGWHERYLTDEYGAKVTIEQEYLIWSADHDGTELDEQPTEANGLCSKRLITENFPDDLDDEVPDWAITNNRRATLQKLVVNPDYDSSQAYVPRSKRPEWCTVGLMGKLAIRTGQPVSPRWKRMKQINSTLDKWLVL